MYGAQLAGTVEVQSAEDTKLNGGENHQGLKQNYSQVYPCLYVDSREVSTMDRLLLIYIYLP